MIGDEERRHVAKALREPSSPLDLHASLYDALDMRPEVVETTIPYKATEHNNRRLLNRLADLIDRPTTTRHGKFRTKYGRETPCCEVCGYSIGDMRWGYCPNCGAVIADD